MLTESNLLLEKSRNELKKKNYYNLEFAKEKLKDLKPFYVSVVDKYLVEYDEPISLIDGKKSNYFVAVTLVNTDKILTMFPVLVSSKENQKTKKLIITKKEN